MFLMNEKLPNHKFVHGKNIISTDERGMIETQIPSLIACFLNSGFRQVTEKGAPTRKALKEMEKSEAPEFKDEALEFKDEAPEDEAVGEVEESEEDESEDELKEESEEPKKILKKKKKKSSKGGSSWLK